MLFKKKSKNDNRTTCFNQKNLQEEIAGLQENNKILNNELSKLKRIVKYSGNKPTYHLDKSTGYYTFIPPKIEYTLYIYINKEEYAIKLEELENEIIDEKRCEFRIEENFCYFAIFSKWNMASDSANWKRHEFVIEFTNGKYVHSSKCDEKNKC